MNHRTKLASGLLLVAVLSTVALSACVPLPSTMQPAPLESPVPTAVETAAAPTVESVAPPATETAAPQATEEPTPSSAQAVPLEGPWWGLVTYSDAGGNTVEVLPGTEVTAQFLDGNVGGTAGCNNYFASYEVDGSSLTVGVVGSTMMACAQDIMDQEAAYTTGLAASASYAIEGDQLQIAGVDGQTLLTYKVVQPTPLVGTIWQLTMYNNGKEALLSVLGGTEITAVFDEQGTVSGSAGCNNYNASYQQDNGTLTVSAAATTRMMCAEPAGVMEQEAAYLEALQGAASYEITGDELDVADADGNVLLIYQAASTTPLVGVTWGLLAYNNGKGGVVSVLNGTEITAIFGEDGVLTGSGGCNNYQATYTVEGDTITIGPAAMTMMMCAEPEGIMEQEAAYLAAIQTAATYSIDGNTLELTNADGARLATYQAQPGPEQAATAEPGTSPAIIGAPWEWVGTLYNNDTKAVPDDPASYVVELLPDGKVSVKADCNMATGTYSLEGNQISIEILASTMAACPPDSLGDQFVKDLNAAESYMMDGEDLIIVLKLDTGSMRLQAPATEAGMSTSPETGMATAPEAAATPATPAEGATEEMGTREADLLGVVWQWESSTPASGQPVTVDNPERYQFMLLPTGTIRVKADCNNGSGTFWIDGSSISIEVLTLTRVACPPGSLSDDFVQMLNQASAYRFEGGNLLLEVGGDGATMQFSSAG
jgi:heat shock protein HslJ